MFSFQLLHSSRSVGVVIQLVAGFSKGNVGSILIGGGSTHLRVMQQIGLGFMERVLEVKIGPKLIKFAEKNYNKKQKIYHG